MSELTSATVAAELWHLDARYFFSHRTFSSIEEIQPVGATSCRLLHQEQRCQVPVAKSCAVDRATFVFVYNTASQPGLTEFEPLLKLLRVPFLPFTSISTMNRTFLVLFFAILCLSLNTLLLVNANEFDQLVKEGPDDISNVMVRKRDLKKNKKKKKETGFDCTSCLALQSCTCVVTNNCCATLGNPCPECSTWNTLHTWVGLRWRWCQWRNPVRSLPFHDSGSAYLVEINMFKLNMPFGVRMHPWWGSWHTQYRFDALTATDDSRSYLRTTQRWSITSAGWWHGTLLHSAPNEYMFCERWPRRMWIYMYSIGHSQDAVVIGSCQGEHLDILTAPTDYIGSPWTVSQSDKRCRLVWDLNNPHSISTTIQITLQLQKTNGRAPQNRFSHAIRVVRFQAVVSFSN